MSKIEVNTVEPQCGSTLTLGACGQTVALGSGASQTGFGRTGTVDWDTSIHTGTVTAATGKGYFVNTTSGGITVNLPAGVVGSIVAVSDYASTANSNNITVAANGSEKINGDAGDYTISTAGLAVTLVYADAARGWKSVTGSDADATGVTNTYITATGGNQPTASGCIVCTNYKIHKFTGPGTFCISAASGPVAVVDYMIVGGGGGGGSGNPGSGEGGGGGGAGGWRASSGTSSGCYTAGPAPLTGPVSAIPVSVQGYPIAVGGGGAGVPAPSCSAGTPGVASSGVGVSSAGGGGAGSRSMGPPAANSEGKDGGSGGGGAYAACGSTGKAGGTGNTPSVSPPQGNDGGTRVGGCSGGGGGGGATAAGSAPPSSPTGGAGGTGSTSCITASPVAYAGGGGGGAPSTGGAGGTGGGASGAPYPGSAPPGTINTGGGGAGGKGSDVGTAGGSGVVIIRYRFQ